MFEVSQRLSYYRAKLLGYLWFDGPLTESRGDIETFLLPMPQDEAHFDKLRQIATLLQDLEEDQLRQASAALPTPRCVQEIQQTGQPTSPAEVFAQEAIAQADLVIETLQALRASASPTDLPSDP